MPARLITGQVKTDASPTLDIDFSLNKIGVDPRIVIGRAGAGAHYNAAGLLVLAGAGKPRLHYNPVTLAFIGLLNEPTSTNRFTWSDDTSNAAWTKVRATTPGITYAASDGSSTLQKLVTDTSTNSHYLSRSLAKAAVSLSYTIAFTVVASERTKCWVWVHGATQSNRAEVWFDVATGTIGNAGVRGSGFSLIGTPTIQAIGGGRYRCVLQCQSTADTQIGALVGVTSNMGSIIDAGDGTSGMFFGEFDFCQQDWVGMHIPTGAAQGIRLSDSITVSGAALEPLLGTGQAITLYAEAIATTDDNSVQRRALAISDGTTSNFAALSRLGGSAQARAETIVAGATVSNALSGAWPINTLVKLASAARQDRFVACLGGATPWVTTSGAMPTGLTTLHVGGLPGGSNDWVGTITKIKIYPRALAERDLMELTA